MSKDYNSTRKKKCKGCGTFKAVNALQICKECDENPQDMESGSQNTASNRKSHICGKCILEVKNDQPALGCAKCNKWFHIACEKISSKLYLALQEQEEGEENTLPFYCRDCKKQIDAYSKKINELEERIKDLEKRSEPGNTPQTMEKMTGVLERVMNRLDQLEEKLRMQDAKMKEREQDKEEIVNEVMRKFEEVRKEEADKERRKNNIVIYNVPESENDSAINDTQQCDRLIRNKLKLEDYEVVDVVRLGRREENKIRPMLVKLGNHHQKWKIMGSARMLKDDPNITYKKMRIVPDMTKKEREENWNLRNELKQKRDAGEQGWYIRRGQLVRGQQNQGAGLGNTGRD